MFSVTTACRKVNTSAKHLNERTLHLKIVKEAALDNMALQPEDSSDIATDSRNHALPHNSDSLSGDEGSSPYSSPPPATKSVSFKPFSISRAQKRAIAEHSSREELASTAKPPGESEGRSTGIADDTTNVAAKKVGRSDGVARSTDLKSLIDAAKQKALANNKSRQADRVEELYQRSLGDKRLTVLLETALCTNATPEQQRELQRYVDGTKTMTDSPRDTTPKIDVKTEEPQETKVKDEEPTNSEFAEIPVIEQTATVSAPTNSEFAEVPVVEEQTATVSTQDQLALYCTLSLWPRYCRLPPGYNTTPEFEAMTSTKINDRGQSMPSHPVPDAWLEAVVTQLSHLLQVARADQRDWIHKVIQIPGYKSQDVHALLAEEVVWATHHGPYKARQKRSEIGVLLECVGIERKGTWWKG